MYRGGSIINTIKPMNFNAPSRNTFVLSLVLAIVGGLGMAEVVEVPYISWTLLGAWIVLAIGCVMRGV